MLTRQSDKLTDNISHDSNDSAIAVVSPTINQTTTNFVFPGPTDPYLCRAIQLPPASTISVQYDVQFLVPPNQTVVRYGQPSDTMPEHTSCSNKLLQSDARAVELDKNLVGHGGEHGVTGCSPSSVSGHQQSESAIQPCQSYGQPICLSAEQLAFCSLV